MRQEERKLLEPCKGYKLNPCCKSKTAVPPNLAAYLVEVIFIIRETFKQKATCNRTENQQMQKIRCWQELGTRRESCGVFGRAAKAQPQLTHWLGQGPQHRQVHVQQVSGRQVRPTTCTKQRPQRSATNRHYTRLAGRGPEADVDQVSLTQHKDLSNHTCTLLAQEPKLLFLPSWG